MERNNIIVGEYLESLSEDKELDRILPILLRLMGFKIIRTPVEAKGQNQQGKDIIAEGKDQDGVSRRYYFEVKGHADKNITEASITKPDGIADSLLSAYLTDYTDLGIPNFNNLPVKVVLVHNGTVKPSATDLLNGTVKRHFKNPEKEFERWGIYELTDLFSKYLFSEYLLTDEESLKLFKKTLALIDQPEYDLRDYKRLIDKLLSEDVALRSRAFNKLFATLNLVSIILWHNAAESNNLLHAINGVSYTVLKTWAWVIRKKLVKRKPINREFKKLLGVQRDLLAAYFHKTLPLAITEDGLFSESGGPFEEIAYPLRSMDYLGWLLYFYQMEQAGPSFEHELEDSQIMGMQYHQKSTIMALVNHNVGTKSPLLDRHSRPITLLALFFLDSKVLLQSQALWLHNYLVEVYNKVGHIHTFRLRFPELTDNMTALVEFVASGERPADYSDKGSMLLLILLELLVIFKAEHSYTTIRRDVIDNGLDLQTAYPDWSVDPDEMEPKLFEGSISDLTAVESSIRLPETMIAFKEQLLAKPDHPIPYQTDEIGLGFLRTLSYIYFYNDVPPDQWRQYLKTPLMAYNDTAL